MGTLALVNVYNENGDRLFSLHVQHDGGSLLKKRLENIIDNGRLIGNLGLTKQKLGEITEEDLEKSSNEKEYAIRPKYGDKCWNELLHFRVHEI